MATIITKTHNFSNRIFGLDLLRAIAILCVLIEHSALILPEGYSLKKISHYFIFDGVGIFFVLSGFLIGTIFLKTLQANEGNLINHGLSGNWNVLVNFWKRRWLRTIPLYYFILLLLTCIIPLMYGGKAQVGFGENRWKFIIFSQNFFTRHPPFFREAWSLAVEEWFYLIVPTCIFICVAFVKIPLKKAVPIISIVLILCVNIWRIIKYIHIGTSNIDWGLDFKNQVFTRLDNLMYGVIAAWVLFFRKESFFANRKQLFWIGLMLLLAQKFILSPIFPPAGIYNCLISFSINSIGTTLMLPLFYNYGETKRNFFSRSITTISITSYSIYLINFSLITGLLGSSFFLRFSHLSYFYYGKWAIFWIASLTGGYLLYHFFELPVYKIRDKISKE